jgi:hypothetical protein
MRCTGCLFGCATILAALLWTSAACGQNRGPIGATYARGVDAYFSGNSAEAEQYLSQAVAELPDDPRPYYFRALVLLRSGRRDEAVSDMQIGAAVEAGRPRQFAVGTALERVQGGDRLLLEQYRREARTANPLQGDVLSRQRPGPTIPSDAAVLRHPPANVSRPTAIRSAKSAAGSEDPFADDSPKPPIAATTQKDPFAAEQPENAAAQKPDNSAPTDKLPPGKLMGVLGHVLERTVPLPSVEGFRHELPSASPAPAKNDPADPPAKPSSNKQPSPANNTEDPFG